MRPADKEGRKGGSPMAMLVAITASWLLILGETFVFFDIVRPLGPALHEGGVPSTVLKVGLTVGLGALWVVVMFVLLSMYLKAHRTPT